MNLPLLFAVFALSVFAGPADSPKEDWRTVMAIPSGMELRIFKTDGTPPIVALMDEANDERIVIVIKNEQQAVYRSEIERVESRAKEAGRTTRQTWVSKNQGDKNAPTPYTSKNTPGPATTVSNKVTFGSKTPYALVYQRPSAK